MDIKALLAKLSSQIKTKGVKLPKIKTKSPTIHHNNQAINDGAVNERNTTPM